MPPILIDGELVAERKPLILPEETKKPVICVFDPVTEHAAILGRALAGIRDGVDIFWQAEFSRTYIGLGDIDELTHPGLIAAKKPVLIFSELEIIPGERCDWGIEMLKNLRAAGLENVPLAIITGTNNLLRALTSGDTVKKLGKLKVNQVFTWGGLQRAPKEQERFFDFVSQILGLKTEP